MQKNDREIKLEINSNLTINNDIASTLNIFFHRYEIDIKSKLKFEKVKVL